MTVDTVTPRSSCRGLAKHILSSVDDSGGSTLSEETLTAMLLTMYQDAYKAGWNERSEQ